MADLPRELEASCEALGARIAASLGEKLGVPYVDGKARMTELLREETRRLLTPGQPTARDELDELRKGKVEQMLGRLDDWAGDLATVVAQREDFAGQIRRAWKAADEMHEFTSPGGGHVDDCPGCRIQAAMQGTETTRG